MNKYLCKNAIKKGKLITCQYCGESYCKYQSYCPTEHKWYNSDLYKECKHLKEE